MQSTVTDGRCNTIPPDTEIHEEMTTVKCVQRQAHLQQR